MITEDGCKIVHLITQDNQPYGSTRKCCEKCGLSIFAINESTDQCYFDQSTYFNNEQAHDLGLELCTNPEQAPIESPPKTESLPFVIKEFTRYSLTIQFLGHSFSIDPYFGPREGLTEDQLLELIYTETTEIRVFQNPNTFSFFKAALIPGTNPKYLEIPIDENNYMHLIFVRRLINNNEDTDLIKEIIQYFFKNSIS